MSTTAQVLSATRVAATKKPECETVVLLQPVTPIQESTKRRLLRRHAPAWVVSGAIHLALIVLLLSFNLLCPRQPHSAPLEASLTIVNESEAENTAADSNDDVGLDVSLPNVAESDRRADASPPEKAAVSEAVAETAMAVDKQDFVPKAESKSDDNLPHAVKPTKAVPAGSPAGAPVEAGFAGRTGDAKEALVKAGGGNAKSEAAVTLGLKWLAKQQNNDGSWDIKEYANEKPGGTGLALLPFLAAGYTHQSTKHNKYDKTVEKGLKWLTEHQKKDGSFLPCNMYSHGIATLALCEAYGMTQDSKLRPYAQKALDFIVESQAPDGSWGYGAKAPGDTSIVGWQIQAMQAAKITKHLRVDEDCIAKARYFLAKKVACDHYGATYGYMTKMTEQESNHAGGTYMPTLSAVGLLCRCYIDGWHGNHPSLDRGVKFLMDKNDPKKELFDVYYYYYATQVIQIRGGNAWSEKWNPKMRDLLIDLQVKEGDDAGSFDSCSVGFMSNGGRLVHTTLALLTLEVYYRRLATYKANDPPPKSKDKK